ncbi:MAG TPA: hypothetical protein VN043_00995, partial [Rhodanobacter sp.]|nr:hypothetical protein [Rhodanobacter sp.]
MKGKLIGCGVIILGVLFSQVAMASNYIPCDGCNYAQMQNAAVAQGVGRYVVGNVTMNNVEALRVRMGSHANSIVVGATRSASRIYLDDGNITAGETSAFSSLVDFYNTSPVGYHKQYNLTIVSAGTPLGLPNYTSAMQPKPAWSLGGIRPMSAPIPGGGTVSYPTPGVNAYTVVNGGPEQNAFLGWVGGLTDFGIQASEHNLLTATSTFHITDMEFIPTVSFTVTFTDGSHIGAYVDLTQSPPQIVITPGTAVDSHGNTIPQSESAVAGAGRQNYSFSGGGDTGDIGNMRKQINGFGIDLPASSDRWACVSSTFEGQTTISCGIY